MDASFISTPESVADWRDQLDVAGKRLVLTNGCFDLLHAGHVRYLREARALGDALVVALNGDASVRELKGEGRPLNSAEDRAEILAALEAVDRVVVFEDKRATGVIDTIRPHVYAKGGDYTPESLNPEERAALERAGTTIRILSLVPGRSTSDLLKRSGKFQEPRHGKLRLAVLGSGKGSNLEAIGEAIETDQLDAEVALVISDCVDSLILQGARGRNFPAIHIEPGSEKPGQLSDAALKEIGDRLRAANIDLVILAGFMRILRSPLLDDYAGRILNIHPSLLPKFPGLEAWKQALEAGESETGCTVHLVNARIDAGEVLGQARVPIEEDDTPESLHVRIQEQEHRLYPAMIGQYGARLREAGQPTSSSPGVSPGGG